ncbi:MAG: hypothetical protein KDD04_12530, partial [Sinomicrobium sp.]|nr:hypothetical protein [Sinomicrobium sp.]
VATDPEIFKEFDYKGRENVLQPLLEAMNSYLDSLNQSDKILPEAFPAKGFPNVFLGSSEAENAPPGSEMMRQEHDKFPR